MIASRRRGRGRIVTDAERLRPVLVNVLTNAQQAVARAHAATGAASSPPVRCVTARLATTAGWRIEVIDRGVGIAPTDLPRIFEPFFTTRRGGSGLGLAIARNIVEGLGGTIAVESRLSAGTTVRIDPAAPRPARHAPHDARDRTAPSCSSTTNRRSGRRCAKALRDEGHDVDRRRAARARRCGCSASGRSTCWSSTT